MSRKTPVFNQPPSVLLIAVEPVLVTMLETLLPGVALQPARSLSRALDHMLVARPLVVVLGYPPNEPGLDLLHDRLDDYAVGVGSELLRLDEHHEVEELQEAIHVAMTMAQRRRRR